MDSVTGLYVKFNYLIFYWAVNPREQFKYVYIRVYTVHSHYISQFNSIEQNAHSLNIQYVIISFPNLHYDIKKSIRITQQCYLQCTIKIDETNKV